jgi:1-pyrroline-5-carboxylate dehydrogenase
MTTATKITYTSTSGDLDDFHRRFDEALAGVRAAAGASYPNVVGGDPVAGRGEPLDDTSPIDTSLLLGRFAAASAADVDLAVRRAKEVGRDWARRPWRERLDIMHRAAELIRDRKYELAALMSLEVGKNRLEAMGDAEESADLIDYYCGQVEEANGFVRPMGQITPAERNTDVLRPYGVFTCIAPFNFPLALSAGMSSAALMAGNTVVYKPSEEAPWTGLRLAEIYRDAGLPAAVGLRIHAGISSRWIKPCLMELGGKNAAVVTRRADLEAAAEGVMRSAFGLQNQKCSATSRVYVDRTVAAPFLELLLEKTRAIRMGDPTERDVYFGPVINQRSVERFERAAAQARKEGDVVLGGERLGGGIFDKGHFVAPTIARLPLTSSLYREELFVPVLAVGEVRGLDQAIEESNAAEYGLTAGIFSADPKEVERFFDEVEAGVCYANKRSGATTGAWPGAQAFCGWKGSGSTGKGGCGPYYVAQFLREQNRTVIQT